jgi:hypothetical protein
MKRRELVRHLEANNCFVFVTLDLIQFLRIQTLEKFSRFRDILKSTRIWREKSAGNSQFLIHRRSELK